MYRNDFVMVLEDGGMIVESSGTGYVPSVLR